MKKLLTALLTLAMAFTMVFATAASAEDGYKDSITWVIGNDQDILDPQNNVSNSKVMPQYYNGLLGYDNDGNVVCKMAESYEASEDKMTWTFHLRQDVYFHSGRHCTAHDFEATFDRLLNTENPQRYTSNASSFIDTAVATDDYTFVITLKEPKAFFLQAIAKQWAFVLNPEYIEKYGADLGKTAESVDGTGPFKCTQWDKGEVMKFEAFENYYEGAPLTHEIVMAVLGANMKNVIISLTIVSIPGVARIARSQALLAREQTYAEAMTAVGASRTRILWRHILPNILSPIIVQMTFTFATAIISEASLSFLGAGIPSPYPSWGGMLNEARGYVYMGWWMIVFPAIFTALSVLGFNLFGDGLRDLIDPLSGR